MAITFEPKKEDIQKYIALVLVIIALAAVAFFLGKTVLKEIEVSPSSVEKEKEVSINFNIFSDETIKNLEEFPDFPEFEETFGEEAIPGRENPFLPYSENEGETSQ